ncbi:MAG: hypothetical protein ACUVSX_00120 [Aggregatilineales bacterium]
MRYPSRLFSSLWAAVGLLLVGCAAQQIAPTATVVFAPPTPLTPTPAQAAADDTLQLVALLPTPFFEPDTGCLECHTNAALLQKLGEEEVVEKISEGTG